MTTSTSGHSHTLRIVAGTILLLAGPVIVTLAAQPRAKAGMLDGDASGAHHRLAQRRPRTAAGPKIRSVAPNTWEVGVPHSVHGKDPDHIDLVVTGSGFHRGDVVKWDTKALTTKFTSPTQLDASVPFGFLGINTLRNVKPNPPRGSGPRGMSASGATGTARIRVRARSGRFSNRALFTVTYVVVGG